MAHKLSKVGRERYQTLHPDLQLLISWYLEVGIVDITLIEGHRSSVRQFELFKKGRTENSNGIWVITDPHKIVTGIDGYKKLGKHNFDPSLAFDFCAYVSGRPELSWKHKYLAYVAGAIVTKAEELYNAGEIEHKCRWGSDWDRDGNFNDHKLVDSPHIELIKP
jgi:hypothetical protein